MNTDQVIAEHFIKSNINGAVLIIEKLEYSAVADFINELPLDLASKVILQMNNYKAAKCLELLKLDIAVKLIESIDLLSTELLLRQCDEVFRNALLKKVDPIIADKIRQKLLYKANSVGAIMRLNVFSLQKDITVSEAKEFMLKERQMITSEIFVTDEKSRIEGIVKLTDLVLAQGTDQISSLLNKDISKIFAEESIKTTINHQEWIKYRILPVISGQSEVLIGSIHFEDVFRRNPKKDEELTRQMVDTGSALGELYWIGLTGLLQSVGNSD